MIDLDLKLNNVDAVIAKLNPEVFKKAFNRTLNDMGNKAKTQMVKEVRKEYNIKARELKKFIKVRKSRYSSMKYVIDVRSSRLNAMRFSPKKLKQKGKMSVLIKKANGRKVFKAGTFVAKNGALLQRIGNTQKIKGVTTISIPQMFKKKILDNAENKLQAEFKNKLSNNLNFYIGKE